MCLLLVGFVPAGSSLKAGFLLSGSPFNGPTEGEVRHGQQPLGIPYALPTTPTFQLNTSGIFSTASGAGGTFSALGGIYANVVPEVAYVAIADGSSLRVTPPAATPFNSSVMWTQSLNFRGYLPIYYVATPPPTVTQLFTALQYKLYGHLAPGATLRLDFHSAVATSTTAQFAPQLRLDLESSEAGDFVFEDRVIAPFYSSVNTYINQAYRLNFSATVSISSPSGAGESWFVLDPGASTGTDHDKMFPWVPPAEVPEPASVALLGFGAPGLVALTRRRRPTHSPSCRSAAA